MFRFLRPQSHTLESIQHVYVVSMPVLHAVLSHTRIAEFQGVVRNVAGLNQYQTAGIRKHIPSGSDDCGFGGV
jgi:hypothetical protein